MESEPAFVEVLTDEEIAVLARPGGIVVSPYLTTLEDGQVELARRTAYRSLLARGVVDPPTPEAVGRALDARDGSVDLPVRQDVLTVMTLRRSARAVVAVARTTSLTQDFWYAHLVEDVLLIEEVSGDGLHRFALAHDHQLADLVVDAAMAPEAGDAAGEPVPLEVDPQDPTPPTAVAEALGEALVRSDVVVRYVGDQDPPLLGMFTGPGGCWLVTARPGSTPVAEPLAAEELRRRIHDLVGQARAEVNTLARG